MAEFKCISCGAVKESEKPCSCPICGYKMFETPYERAEIFRKEIKDFIAHLKLSEIPEPERAPTIGVSMESSATQLLSKPHSRPIV